MAKVPEATRVRERAVTREIVTARVPEATRVKEPEAIRARDRGVTREIVTVRAAAEAIRVREPAAIKARDRAVTKEIVTVRAAAEAIRAREPAAIKARDRAAIRETETDREQEPEVLRNLPSTDRLFRSHRIPDRIRTPIRVIINMPRRIMTSTAVQNRAAEAERVAQEHQFSRRHLGEKSQR